MYQMSAEPVISCSLDIYIELDNGVLSTAQMLFQTIFSKQIVWVCCTNGRPLMQSLVKIYTSLSEYCFCVFPTAWFVFG